MSVFFLGSWEMNRSAEQTNRVNREKETHSLNKSFIFDQAILYILLYFCMPPELNLGASSY